MRGNEFWALNWLRFSLALYIVLYHTLNGHYKALEGTWIGAALDLGNIATTVFFVLSGFLLTHVYAVLKDARHMNKKSFFVARFSSLYPLHLIGLFLALIPAFLTIYVRGGISVPVDTFGLETRMLGQEDVLLAAVTSFALLNAWNPYYTILNGPSWSLSALACYYALFPFIAPKLYRMKSPALGLAVLGVFFCLPGIVADLLHRTDLFTDGLLHHNPLIRLPLFISGMVLCMLFVRTSKLKPLPLQLALLGVIVVVTFLGAVYLRMEGLQNYHSIRNGMYLPAALALVWLCAYVPQSVNTKVKYWGARLGGASLPMFFLHVPLFQLFSKVEKIVAGYINATSTTSLSSVISAAQDVHQALIVYPLYLAPLVITCVVLQEKFVVPMQARIRQYFLNDKAHSTAAESKAVHLPATDLSEYGPMTRDAVK